MEWKLGLKYPLKLPMKRWKQETNINEIFPSCFFPLEVWVLKPFNCTYRITATCHLDETTPIISITTREGWGKKNLFTVIYIVWLSLAMRLSIHWCPLSIFYTCRNPWQFESKSLQDTLWCKVNLREWILFCYCRICPLNNSDSRTASWQFGLLPVYDHFTLEWWYTWTSFSPCEIKRHQDSFLCIVSTMQWINT